MDILYRQVAIKKETSHTYQTCWIPASMAKECDLLIIKDILWRIIWVYSNIINGPVYLENMIEARTQSME